MASASAAEQDDLKHIYLQQEEPGRATTHELADRLRVKPPSVTAMFKRLADHPGGPLVAHTPYHGVVLTDKGLAVALEVLRHHRLIELFLSEFLDVPWGVGLRKDEADMKAWVNAAIRGMKARDLFWAILRRTIPRRFYTLFKKNAPGPKNTPTYPRAAPPESTCPS